VRHPARRRRSSGPAPALVGALAVGLVGSACVGGDPFEPLVVPPPNPDVTTTTTAPPDYRGVALAPVEGTTTTSEVVVRPGSATVAGRVDGPDGPVPGATVRLERLVGDASAVLDVSTGDDGTWQAPGVLGGRYRVRAWRSPDLAAVEAQVLFVPGGETTTVGLVVERFRPTVVDLAVAPDPPPVGEPTNVVVRVSSRVVDDDGVVRAVPLPGVGVALSSAAAWSVRGSEVATTGPAGSATFTLVCGRPGPQPLTVTLAPAEVFPLAPPDCVAPVPPSPPSPPRSPAPGSRTGAPGPTTSG
jgi:hypothetical protein